MSFYSRIVLFFILLPFFTLKSFAQEKILSEKEIREYRIRPLNHKTLGEYRDILLKSKTDVGWGKYYGAFAYYMAYKRKADSTIYYAEKAIENYEKIPSKSMREQHEYRMSYFSLGRGYQEKNQFEESLIYFLKSKEIEKKYELDIYVYTTVGVANNHLELGNDSIALKYYKEVLKDTNYIKSGRSKATTEMRIGILYHGKQIDSQDSALFYFHKARKTSLQTGANNNLISIYNNLGDTYRLSKKKDSAVYFYKKAEALFLNPAYSTSSKETNNQRKLFRTINNGYIKIHNGKTKEAINDLSNVLDTLQLKSSYDYDKEDKDLIMSIYENLALAYKTQKSYEKMQEALEQKENFLVQFYEKQMNLGLEELQVNYETREKEEEIKRLELERENQAIIQNQQKQTAITIISVLLLSLVAVGYYFRQQGLLNKFKESALKQQLLRTQMDPHFYSNALNQVMVLNKLKPAEVEPYIIELSKLTRLILENSRDEFVLLRKEIEAIEHYLALESQFSENFKYTIEIGEGVSTDELLVPPMMIQPLVENAILHGVSQSKETGKINIHIKKNTLETLLCTVSDNGTGYGNSNTNKIRPHSPLSQNILAERLDIYHKKREIKNPLRILSKATNNELDKGTQVQLILPTEFL